MSKNRATPSSYLDDIGKITKQLESLGCTPVLIGGMALVVLGSRRVTRDFDFVIKKQSDNTKALIDIFYDNGLELVAKLTDEGEVLSTIDNRRVAAIRLEVDAPVSAYFFNPKTGLKIDLLFDFPISAEELATQAQIIKISSQKIRIASEHHLLRLKKIAKSSRSKAGDDDDIKFLVSRRNKSKK